MSRRAEEEVGAARCREIPGQRWPSGGRSRADVDPNPNAGPAEGRLDPIYPRSLRESASRESRTIRDRRVNPRPLAKVGQRRTGVRQELHRGRAQRKGFAIAIEPLLGESCRAVALD